MTACMVKKCYIFLAASFLTCLLLVPRNIFPGTATVSDGMQVPYRDEIPTESDEAVTERVLQTILSAGTAGYTSWHVPERHSKTASPPRLPSQVEHGGRHMAYPPQHKIKRNDGIATVSDGIPVPYRDEIPTDETVTERVLQTILPAGTAGYTSWHVPERHRKTASPPRLPSRVEHGGRHMAYPPRHKIKRNYGMRPRSQESPPGIRPWSQEGVLYLPESNDSQSDNVTLRSQFQKSAIDHYCSLYYQSYFQHTPYYKDRHALYDENHRAMFCFLPKVGCTNLKILFIVNQELYPRTELDKPRENLDKEIFRSALKQFRNQANEKLIATSFDSYFKFMMVRNPLERLLSAYRDKVEKYSRNFSVTTDPSFTWLRNDIFKRSHPELYMQWVEDGMKPVKNSFYDFINYWLNPGGSRIAHNDHFSPMIDVCKPCSVRYDFYGNFKHFDRDAQVLVDRIGASSSDLKQGYYSEDSSTDQRMNVYYSTLTETQRIAVVKKMSLDLEFYYTLFPEERDSHKQILNVSYELRHM